MADGSLAKPVKNEDSPIPEWLTPKVDGVISVVLVYLSTILGGLGLYFVVDGSWESSPLILVGLMLWGVSCVGLRRLLESNHQK